MRKLTEHLAENQLEKVLLKFQLNYQNVGWIKEIL